MIGKRIKSTHKITNDHTILKNIESRELIRGKNNPIRHKLMKLGIGSMKYTLRPK